MSAMDQMIGRVIDNMSPVERRYVANGDLSVATWIAKRVLDVTDSQAEAIAQRVFEATAKAAK